MNDQPDDNPIADMFAERGDRIDEVDHLKAEVARLTRERDAVIGLSILHHPRGKLATLTGWKMDSDNNGDPVGTVTPCFEFWDTEAEAIDEVLMDAGIKERTKEVPE